MPIHTHKHANLKTHISSWSEAFIIIVARQGIGRSFSLHTECLDGLKLVLYSFCPHCRSIVDDGMGSWKCQQISDDIDYIAMWTSDWGSFFAFYVENLGSF
jgi:hypothetical protein